MLEIVPFDPAHLTAFEPQPDLLTPIEDLVSAKLDCLIGDTSWTGLIDDQPVACAGLQQVWPGRSVAWSVLSPEIGARYFLSVDRRVRREILNARRTGTRRIEATIDPFFPQGRALRWALTLGFQVEGYMRHWGPDGRDMCLVAITGEN